MKRFITCLLVGWIALASGGCCSHGSWGDQDGWKCHDSGGWDWPKSSSHSEKG